MTRSAQWFVVGFLVATIAYMVRSQLPIGQLDNDTFRPEVVSFLLGGTSALVAHFILQAIAKRLTGMDLRGLARVFRSRRHRKEKMIPSFEVTIEGDKNPARVLRQYLGDHVRALGFSPEEYNFDERSFDIVARRIDESPTVMPAGFIVSTAEDVGKLCRIGDFVLIDGTINGVWTFRLADDQICHYCGSLDVDHVDEFVNFGHVHWFGCQSCRKCRTRLDRIGVRT